MPEKTISPLLVSILAKIKASEADEEVLQNASVLLPHVEEIHQRLLIEQGKQAGLKEAMEEIQLFNAF